jgi:DNA repair protein SbcC/Rad50
MIPHRIQLAGFLSYKDQQDVRFDGAAVWMLAGSNGSGKSSIFDGVTYALVGHHRGGGSNAAELINKESSKLAVEFDFKLDGQLFRIKRTLSRGKKNNDEVKATQQVFVCHPPEKWEAVPDTNKKTDLDKWIRDKIGLTYETFTSSVLLLQGKAEKLLDSKPTGRAEVLASIVDLERYQRLHEKANDHKKALKSKLDTVTTQTEGVPDVSDLEYSAAIIKIDECEQARSTAQQKIDEVQILRDQSRRWNEATTRATAASQKLAQAEMVLSDAVKIEKEQNRLVELTSVLPAVNESVTVRGDYSKSQRTVEQLQKEREDATDRRMNAERAAEQAKRQREQSQRTLKNDELMLDVASKRLRELASVLGIVHLVESEQTKVNQLAEELKRLPKSPEADLKTAQAEERRLNELDRVLPNLERVQTERHDLAQAVRKEIESKKLRDDYGLKGKNTRVETDQLAAELERVRAVRMAADNAVAVAQALSAQATAAVAEFGALHGSKSCKSCGQPLTPAHFQDEKSKREAALLQAEKTLKQALVEARTATENERVLAERKTAMDQSLTELRDCYKDHDAAWKQAKEEIKRLTDSLNLRYAEMPDPYRQQIAATVPTDWTTTAYPERDELTNLRREAGTLAAIRRQVQDAQNTLRKFEDLNSRTDAASQNLTKLKAQLPSDDVTQLRAEQTQLQTQETTLTNSIRASKLSIETHEREHDKFGREAHQAVTLLTDLVGKLKSEDEKQTIFRSNLERSVKQLPEAWRPLVEKAGFNDYTKWKTEHDDLQASGVEAKYRQLEQARLGLAALREEANRLATEAEAFPPLTRKSAEEVRSAEVLARQAFDEADIQLRTAQKHKDKLEGYREQRAKLGEQYKEFDAGLTKYKLLTDLLGRDRLQRYLVRQAERQIVDYANAVLDRLSGGQLYLKSVITDDGTDKALELECYNRTLGGAPINVMFLSGSQRFRVAVSLALAIGQYASHQHRPIESVIIDEGFGCLDRQGRQVMIQELQNLRGHLHCILLVSHQEEFAEAFADGYRFELQDGSTRVSRFQR